MRTTSVACFAALATLVPVALATACAVEPEGLPAGSGGAPTGCPAGLIWCGVECVSAASNAANCGACGVVCGFRESCTNGLCTCQPGLQDCGGSCVQLAGDGANCGACGLVCAAGTYCSAGTCGSSCAAGLSPCGQSCVNVTNDAGNCGACGVACSAGASCVAGACVGGTGGAPGTGGALATGGVVGTGGAPATGGFATGGDATGGTPATGGIATGGTGGTSLEPFSFFVTSLEAMRRLSGNENGFGGDLRHGEATGLAGADKICTEIADNSLPGAGAKGWRAFLSVSVGPSGGPVNAIDRVGPGPWYDRLGRLVAQNITGLVSERPVGDDEIVNDLPNEYGEPNHSAGGNELDNHDVVTGSNEQGQLSGGTCSDWTSTTSTSTGGGPFGGSGPLAGHSWPANSGQHWISSHSVPGCAPSVVTGEGTFGGTGIGDSGGYGAIYCFALAP